MFKRAALMMFVVSSSACGDDAPTDDTKADSGAQGAVIDGGVAITPGKVLNVGDECASAGECAGVAGKTRCLTEQAFPLAGGGITYNGGYCSAECTANAECTGDDGSPGECPFGSMLSMAGSFPGIGSLLNGLSVCLKPCATATDCRDEYTCDTVAGLLPMNSQIPTELLTSFLPATKYCLSTDIDVPDAGLGGLIPGNDAGAATDAEVTTQDGGGTDDVDGGEHAADAGEG